MTMNDAIKALREAGIESAEHDARLLFSHFGSFAPHELVLKTAVISDELIKKPLEERISRRPLQYIIGEVGFYKESFSVSEDCLIPRQDTEILVDYAVKNIPEGESFLDICTGSGCIAISTVKNTKNTRALAIDLSEKALECARRNAVKNGVLEKIDFLLADALEYEPKERYFAVLSNPPYVTEEEYRELEKELYYEPKMALVARDGGLEFYKKLVPAMKDSIKDSGFIAFEIGSSQSNALLKIAEENSMTAEIINDLSGLARVAVLKKI